jgi:putative peptide zinc metalloprotease protein
MASEDPTFSESWYRIADQKICLRPGIRVRRQYFRGERWIVLENPLNNQFFRIHPAAYELIARLRPDRTVQEVWEECMEKLPDETPGQEAALRLLSQLYQANLLQYPQATDSAKLFERHQKRRQLKSAVR